MNKKTWIAIIVILVVALIGIVAFGNFNAEDAQGRANKIVKSVDSGKDLKVKDDKKGDDMKLVSEKDVKKGEKIVDKEMKIESESKIGSQPEAMPEEGGFDSEAYAELVAECEIDENEDGYSDNSYDFENGMPVQVLVEDCDDWANDQVALGSDASACAACNAALAACTGDLGNVPPEIHQAVIDGCGGYCGEDDGC